ncbi:MAG: PTS sugar transporter subunit IIC/EAL domain-containing protein [Gammaproteobacteria bacterium]|nr:PTS sugar transporter subunit IIC/EAL domain-containing protein [Gammaproteobacteria bacterium]
MNTPSSLALRAYSDAFINVVPYVIIMALLVLSSNIFEAPNLTLISSAVGQFFPIVLLTAIAFQLAKRYKLPPFIIILLSMAVFIGVEAASQNAPNFKAGFSSQHTFLVLIIPFLALKSLLFIHPNKQDYYEISKEVSDSIAFLYPVLFVFVGLTASLILMQQGLGKLLTDIEIPLSDDLLLITRLFISHLLSFFGVHGVNVFDTATGSEFLTRPIFEGLTYKQYYDLFVILGGDGAGLSLLLAVFIAGKTAHSQRIARLATPFVLFNINEILIFGLPLIFNKYLLVPFIAVPLTNIAVSYVFLSYYPVEVIHTNISWITPIFVNSYLVTEGNLSIIALQAFLLAMGTAIYIPFVKAYTTSQSVELKGNVLANNLDLDIHLTSQQGIRTHKVKHDFINLNFEVDQIINLISNDNLRVYFQPKVDIKNKQCQHYEALLRIQMPDGSIKGPFFLEKLEAAGHASIIDLWVCKQVYSYIKHSDTDKAQVISINLHPDTLSDTEIFPKIVALLSGLNIDFEIIERDLLNTTLAMNNIKGLKQRHFTLSMDDFGTGFSSLKLLCSLPIDTLKIDKSLIDLIETPKGFIACKNIADLCEDMGFDCVAEGVETFGQYEKVASLNIKYVQGFYFSKAFPYYKISSYTPFPSPQTE